MTSTLTNVQAPQTHLKKKKKKENDNMLKTIEFIFPTVSTEDPYTKDAKCLSDIIENFIKDKGDKIKVLDIKYSFNILSKIQISEIDIAGAKQQAREMDIPISSALVIYEEGD